MTNHASTPSVSPTERTFASSSPSPRSALRRSDTHTTTGLREGGVQW